MVQLLQQRLGSLRIGRGSGGTAAVVFRLLLILGVLAAVGSAALARDADRLDWSTWQHLPVLHRGRIKPLDTFARETVESICGRTAPKLSLAGANAAGDLEGPELAEARELFPDGKPRKFTAAELLLSWLVEPERWERAPFLHAEHARIRKELFDLPVRDAEGNRLKYVSPWQVANSSKFYDRWEAIAQKREAVEAKKETFEPTVYDKKVIELYEALTLYRLLTFVPAEPDSPNNRSLSRLRQAIRTWLRVQPGLRRIPAFSDRQGTKELMAAASEAAGKLSAASRQRAGREGEEGTLKTAEAQLLQLRDAASGLHTQLAAYAKRLVDQPPAGVDPAGLETMRVDLRTLAAWTADLRRQAQQAILALYDNGYGLRIVPALDPAALEGNRDDADDANPWLPLQTVLFGSEAVIGNYPRQELQEVRKTFQAVGAAYADRRRADREELFHGGVNRFAAAVRALGERVEPLRRQLPILHPDETLMEVTAYPPDGFTGVEVAYNRFDPFFWSWTISLLALICFGLSFGVLRKPMFWLGILALTAAQLPTLAGFGLRWYITGLVPVTSMFETVVFAGLMVSALGIWFALLPLLWPGLSSAWRMTALPLTWEAKFLGNSRTALLGPAGFQRAHWLLLLPRLAISVAVFYVLAFVPYGSTDSPIFSLVPKTAAASSFPTFNSLLTWSVGLCVLGLTVYYVPRAALALVLGLGTIPLSWIRQGMRQPLEQTLQRKVFALTAAAVALLAGALAYFAPAPVFVREINTVQPILRDNFWLLLHVLTITGSYGAGALAWGLGNIALGYYLFGRYRDPAAPSPSLAAQGHRPAGNYVAPPEALVRRAPEPCAALATYVYKATQVAVLFLIVGTITGALWADVAWGRFWGWDSKEVAALISALVYLVILHGRYAGWCGNFGLAIGAVMGATAIIGAWYGVNYLFGSGLHAYGSGAGGQLEVSLIIAANWLLLAAAGVRYLYETRVPRGTAPSAE